MVCLEPLKHLHGGWYLKINEKNEFFYWLIIFECNLKRIQISQWIGGHLAIGLFSVVLEESLGELPQGHPLERNRSHFSFDAAQGEVRRLILCGGIFRLFCGSPHHNNLGLRPLGIFHFPDPRMGAKVGAFRCCSPVPGVYWRLV